jgi:hypothetical protein
VKVWVGYLGQVENAASHLGAALLCTGDVFDVGWYDQRKKVQRCPPELINLAEKHLPKCFGVPGNHDLPYHKYEDLTKSAFWTLVRTGTVNLLEPENPETFATGPDTGFRVTGVPFGCELPEVTTVGGRRHWTDIAVVHRYVWAADHGYPGAPEEDNVVHRCRELKAKGYSIGVYGDNHKGFVIRRGGVTLVNGGAFLNRKNDEKGYRPFVCGIHHSGKVSRIYLDTSEDKWRPDYVPANQVSDAAKRMREAFIQEIKEVAELEEFDFLELLEQTAKLMSARESWPTRDELLRLVTQVRGSP